MVPLVSFILLTQAILLHRVTRSWLFPPAIYALYWAGVLSFSMVFKFGDYSLSLNALMVFLIGSVMFSIGGYSAILFFSKGIMIKTTLPSRKKFIQNCIGVYSIGLLALVPFFFRVLQQVNVDLGIEEFAVAVRFAFGRSDRAGIPRYFLSLTSIGAILAYCAAWLYEGTRRDKVVLGMAVLSPLSMYVLMFGRTPIYMLLTGVTTIMVFRGTVRLRRVFLLAAMGISLVVLLGTMLGKGPDFESGKSPLYAVVENLAIYFVGGPVGFGYVMENPASVGESGLSLRFFTQAVESLGADILLPNHVLGYISNVLGNVYTIYFAYWLDWGWWGVSVMAFLAGFFCTSIYIMAMRGYPTAGVGMGMVTAAILNSATGDWIFLTSIPWILLVLLVYFLWNLPIPSRSRGSHIYFKTSETIP
ncbi:oligosaccharide repeat unit polymerase [bacterium]|nr:oligosaccharide repeat unit polymerase [bacterium]